MKTQKTLLAAALLLPAVGMADVFDARTLGRGGVGLTMGEYNQATLNPALINTFDENDDFSFALNAGAIASDQDGFVDAAEDIRDDIRALFGTGNSPKALEINQRMQGYDKAMGQVDIGAGIMIGIPNNTLSAALVVKSKVTLGIGFDYDAADAAILQGISTGTNTDNDLQSQAGVSAVGIVEAGLLFGKKFGAVETGVLVKAQRIELYEYSANVANFDEDDATDSNNNTSYDHLNLDIGANLRLGDEGQFVIAGVIENLIPKTFQGPVPPVGSSGVQSDFKMKPVAVAAVGYGNTYFKTEVSLDLTAREGFDRILETQFARAGVELSAGRHFHIRAGYRTDTKDNVSDLVTLGFGITPWDRFNIDLGAAKGKGETLGAALQIGFKI